MSTTLITGIYYSDREGELGGRCWREQYYFSSFQNIYNFGLPTVIYCDKQGYPKLKRWLNYLDYIGIPNNIRSKLLHIEKKLSGGQKQKRKRSKKKTLMSRDSSMLDVKFYVTGKCIL